MEKTSGGLLQCLLTISFQGFIFPTFAVLGPIIGSNRRILIYGRVSYAIEPINALRRAADKNAGPGFCPCHRIYQSARADHATGKSFLSVLFGVTSFKDGRSSTMNHSICAV